MALICKNFNSRRGHSQVYVFYNMATKGKKKELYLLILQK